MIGWNRCIAHVDMDAFFASIEQKYQPELRNKPIAITNGGHGSCVITCSYEARAFGVKTGMRFSEARNLCPDLLQCGSRPDLYAKVSEQVMTALRDEITPDIEIYSVDEAFLDISKVHQESTDPYRLARRIRACVFQAVGLPASVGLGGDKTTAKLAAKKAKPYGVWVVSPKQARHILGAMPVGKLCGIGPGIQRFLAKHGVHTCAGVSAMPVHILANRFGHGGKRIWLMCQGRDPDPIQKMSRDPKSMGHGKILPPGVYGREKLRGYLSYMAFKLSCRLQKHGLWAEVVTVEIATLENRAGVSFPLKIATHNYQVMQKLVSATLEECWYANIPYRKVQITATKLVRARQMDLFQKPAKEEIKKDIVATVMTSINEKYGFATLRPASIQKMASPDVIAPSWQPSGPRQSIACRPGKGRQKAVNKSSIGGGYE